MVVELGTFYFDAEVKQINKDISKKTKGKDGTKELQVEKRTWIQNTSSAPS